MSERERLQRLYDLRLAADYLNDEVAHRDYCSLREVGLTQREARALALEPWGRVQRAFNEAFNRLMFSSGLYERVARDAEGSEG